MTPYEYIKKEIILGDLQPGSVFDEAIVQSALGVSRTPVREAVLKLNEEGYLTIIPRKGTIVSFISFSDVKQIYEYRSMLEPLIMEKIAVKVDNELLLKWKRYFSSLINDEIGNLDLPVERDFLDDVDKGFHLSLAKMLNNSYVYKEISYLMDLSCRVRYLSNISNNDRYIASLNEHIEIIDALLNSDGALASNLMKKHLKNTLEGYRLWI